jgi:hypothetical protein
MRPALRNRDHAEPKQQRREQCHFRDAVCRVARKRDPEHRIAERAQRQHRAAERQQIVETEQAFAEVAERDEHGAYHGELESRIGEEAGL